jgi:SSS family solute:Na+ symporter
MSVTFLDICGIILYFAATAVFAYFTRRTRSFAEFSVGNRRVPAMMIFASLAATIIGPGFSVGFTGKGYLGGYAFYFLALTYGLQTILVGIFFAPRLTQFKDCYTIGDVMEKRYGRTTHLLTGIVSVGLCVGFTAVMGKVAGGLLHAVTGWPLFASIATVTMFTAFFTFTGGVRAVIATDAMHFTWYTLVIPAMLLMAFFQNPQPVQAISAKAAELTASGFAGLNGMQILGIMVSFLLGETLIPPYTNRALAARTQSASRSGFVGAGLFCLVWLAIVASLGICAHQFLPASTAPDDVFVALGRRLLPSGVFGLLLAAIIAIVMSSQESVLNSASVSLVRDILGNNRRLSDKHALLTGRIGTVVIAAVSVFVSVYSPSIIDGLLICYSIWAPSVLLPFLIALYRKRTVPMAGWLSMVSGGATSILWQTVLKEPAGVPAILAGLAMSITGYFVGHLIGESRAQGELEI